MRGVKIARVAKNLTQSELAKMMGVSVKTIGSWERGKFNPTTENLIKLSEKLETSVDELVKKYDD